MSCYTRIDMSITEWHITWGTYGARLHGGERLTVERAQNQRGEPFVEVKQSRETWERNRLRGTPVSFNREQRRFIEKVLPAICARGGWTLIVCAAERDHVHILVAIPSEIHGKRVRELLKRWLTQELNRRWTKPESGRWWASGGSTIAVRDASYRVNVVRYIERQRV